MSLLDPSPYKSVTADLPAELLQLGVQLSAQQSSRRLAGIHCKVAEPTGESLYCQIIIPISLPVKILYKNIYFILVK